MRKLLSSVAALCLLSVLAGCANQQAAQSQPSAPQPTVTPKTTVAPVAETKTEVRHSEQNLEGMKPPYHVVRSFRGVPILMYHSIDAKRTNGLMVSPTDFAAEMEHLQAAGYNTITFSDLDDFLSGRRILPPKPVLITFDDGYKNNYTAAYPILKKLHMRATVFVVSGFVGGKNSLSWDEIQEMQDSGVFEIGGHTRSHLDLTTLSRADLIDQIEGCKKEIEAHIGKPLVAFAYPSGRYNDAVVQETLQAGFEFAVTTHEGLASETQGLLTLKRVRVPGDESPKTFANVMQ